MWLTQPNPNLQSLLLLHVVPHTLPLHAYGEHVVTFAGLQVPTPSHVLWVCVPIEQLVAQAVPGAYRAQAPAPLQDPFC